MCIRNSGHQVTFRVVLKGKWIEKVKGIWNEEVGGGMWTEEVRVIWT